MDGGETSAPGGLDASAPPAGTPTRRAVAAACASGAALALGTLPGLAPLGLAALTPLAYELARSGPRRAFGLAVLAGAVAYGFGFSFLVPVLESAGGLAPSFAWLAVAALGAWNGVALGLAAALAAAVRARAPLALALPLTYAALESVWPAPLPYCLGALWLETPVAQLAELVGPHGLTALALVPACLLASLFPLRGAAARRGAGAPAAVLAVSSVVGFGLGARSDGAEAGAPRLAVGLVQPAGPRGPARFARIVDDVRALEREGAALVIVSEGAYGAVLPDADVTGTFAGGLPGVGVPTLLGAVSHDGTYAHNAALLVTPGGLAARYDKSRLLPFAEALPTEALRGLAPRAGRFTPGAGPAAVDAAGARVGVSICYEDTLFEHTRATTNVGAELVANLTHDAWFAATPRVAEQHLALARLGAIATRRHVVRATEGGITAWIDARGAVRARAPRDVPAGLRAAPARRSDTTPYAALGSAPLRLAALGLLALAVAGRRRPRLSPSAPS